MDSAFSLLSEDCFLCPICLEVFTDPISTPCGHNYCKGCITHYWDTKVVCKCPLCNKTFSKSQEFSVNKVFSEMVQQFRRHKFKEEYEAKAEAEVQQMIQDRQLKIQEVKHSVGLSRKDADAVMAISVQVCTALISCIERSQAELIGVIEGKQKTAEKQAEGVIKDLQQEIAQLEKRSSELKQLSHTEECIHLFHTWMDLTKVNVHHSSYVGTVRTSVAQLEKALGQEMKEKLRDAELKRIQHYKVDITLDPETAYSYLILSEDRKQVSCGNVQRKLPDNTGRFSQCPSVLGKQSFSSGRFYYEVQVKGKTGWDLGVARESINRKGRISLNPNNGYWSIWLRNGNEYCALAGPTVPLPVREKVQKVGVFVDYEEGLVSFYEVEARILLYSFTGCTFTDKLYPYFSPCLNVGGRNSARLIISPVNHEEHKD